MEKFKIEGPKENESSQDEISSLINNLKSRRRDLERLLNKEFNKNQINAAKKSLFLKRALNIVKEKESKKISEFEYDKEQINNFYNIQKLIEKNKNIDVIKLTEEEFDLLIKENILSKKDVLEIKKVIELINEARKKNVSVDPQLEPFLEKLNLLLKNQILAKKEEISNFLVKIKSKQEKEIKNKIKSITKRYQEKKLKIAQELKNIKEEVPEIEDVEYAQRYEHQNSFLKETGRKIQSLEDLHRNSFEKMLRSIGPDGFVEIVGYQTLKEIFNKEDEREIGNLVQDAFEDFNSKQNFNNLLKIFKEKIIKDLGINKNKETQDALIYYLEQAIISPKKGQEIRNPKNLGKDEKEPLFPWYNKPEYTEEIKLFQKLNSYFEIKDNKISFNFKSFRDFLRKNVRDINYLDRLLDLLKKGAEINSEDVYKKNALLGSKIKPKEFNPTKGIPQEKFKKYTEYFYKRRKETLDVLKNLYHSGIDIILDDLDNAEEKDKEFVQKLEKLINEINALINENKVLNFLLGEHTGKRIWDLLKKGANNNEAERKSRRDDEKEDDEKEVEAFSKYVAGLEDLQKMVKENSDKYALFIGKHSAKRSNGKLGEVYLGLLFEKNPKGFKLVKIVADDDIDVVRRMGFRIGQNMIKIPQWLEEWRG